MGQELVNTASAGKSSKAHMIVPAAMIVVVFIMLVPLPTIALDFFITVNITMSIVILLVSMYIDRPVSFSVFPSMLLILTLYRLSLNLTSTRLILLNGNAGTSAAGKVIKAFGQFVVGGNYVVGFVVFIVIIVIQYVVVNHGAVRISEVTARFTLDAMPGKQMSIDADLSSGSIDEQEAKKRREELNREAEFYGSMDGAIRFTQRDAVAGIIITIVNIVAGFIIGVVQFHMELSQALKTYTILTIGDGLVSAIPSLLISVAGGIVTTRATARLTLGEEVSQQLSFNPRPLYMGGTILLLLALVPGLPKVSFVFLGGVCLVLGRLSSRKEKERAQALELETEEVHTVSSEEQIQNLLKVDILALEIGYGLIPIVDPSQGGDLVNQIKNIRKQIASELGIVVPPIHISDNLKLQPREYAFLIKDSVVEKGELHPQLMLAINPGGVEEEIDGIKTREPSYNLPAVWIKPEQKEQVQLKGYTVVDASTVISTHLSEIIRRYAAEILTRQETQRLIDIVAEDHPKVVEELIPNLLTLGQVQKIFQNLLKERIPIRDMVTILETLADHAVLTKNIQELTERVRQALQRVICSRLVDEKNELRVFTMSPEFERIFYDNIKRINGTEVFIPDPESAKLALEKFNNIFGKNPEMMRSTILCSTAIRTHVRNFIEQYFPQLNILSYSEIPPNIKVTSMGMVN